MLIDKQKNYRQLSEKEETEIVLKEVYRGNSIYTYIHLLMQLTI